MRHRIEIRCSPRGRPSRTHFPEPGSRIGQWVSSSKGFSMMSRRSMMVGGVAGMLAAAGLSSAQAYASRYVHPYEPVLERLELTLPEEHAGLDGLKIGFVTDTHVGPFIANEDVSRVLDLLRPHTPDLLLLGGDYAS